MFRERKIEDELRLWVERLAERILALFLTAFFSRQFFAFGLGEFAQLLFTHRPRHLPGRAFQGRFRSFPAFSCQSSTSGHLLFF